MKLYDIALVKNGEAHKAKILNPEMRKVEPEGLEETQCGKTFNEEEFEELTLENVIDSDLDQCGECF